VKRSPSMVFAHFLFTLMYAFLIVENVTKKWVTFYYFRKINRSKQSHCMYVCENSPNLVTLIVGKILLWKRRAIDYFPSMVDLCFMFLLSLIPPGLDSSYWLWHRTLS
jgi:hypothetical protein